MKYYLSRWFSIFQWLTGTSHLSRHFPVLWGGNLQSCPEHGRWDSFHTRFTLQPCHFSSIQQYLRFEWRFVSVFASPISCFQSGCFKAWREHYCSSYWTAWSSFSFCVTVPVKKKKEKHHTAAGIFFSCLLGSLKWAQLYVSLQQLSADCVTSVFCFFIMSFSLAAFSVWEKSKIKMNSKSV